MAGNEKPCKICGSTKTRIGFTVSKSYVLVDKMTGRPMVMDENDTLCKACEATGFDYYRNLETIPGYH